MSADTFIAHMLDTALWSSGDEDHPFGYALDATDIAPETRARLEAEGRAFYNTHAALIHSEDAPLAQDFDGSTSERQAAMAGHDYWLTRCGHGAGFWDGDWPEPAATTLTDAATAAGNVDLYLGDDGLIYA